MYDTNPIKIIFPSDKHTQSQLQNGIVNTTGLNVMATPDEIQLSAITSNGATAPGYIPIPNNKTVLGDLLRAVRALTAAAQNTEELNGAAETWREAVGLEYDVEVDDDATFSVSETGTWVQSWTFVSQKQAITQETGGRIVDDSADDNETQYNATVAAINEGSKTDIDVLFSAKNEELAKIKAIQLCREKIKTLLPNTELELKCLQPQPQKSSAA